MDQLIPAAMNGACKGWNKCEYGDFFYSRIVCDTLMGAFIEDGIAQGFFKFNPCKRLFKWNCVNGAWVDKEGERQ